MTLSTSCSSPNPASTVPMIALKSAFVCGLFTIASVAVASVAVAADEASLAEQVALKEIGAQIKLQDNEIVDLKADVSEWAPAEYRLVGKQTSLKSLTISGDTITDENLKLLTSLKNLDSISTNSSQLTDEGYKLFQEFPKLTKLALWHPSRNVEGFTGSGLRHLKPLKQLTQLTFAGAKTGDEAMLALAELSQLESYSQWHNQETAEGLKNLAELRNLKNLRLGQRLYDYKLKSPASFNAETFDVLATMQSLESIDIMEARLTFDAIIKLKALPNLKRLRIHQIAISEAEVERLKKELPDVEIIWEPLTADEEEAVLVKKLKI